MKRSVIAIGLLACFVRLAHAQTEAPAPAPAIEGWVVHHARGTFEVALNSQATETETGGSVLGRMSIAKEFHGDLEAASKGEMLTAATTAGNSAGYVAIERVSGKLHGRSGSFVLQHSGIMRRGTPELTITVVPDSGSGQLVGLAGKMSIEIASGVHSYDLEYTLPVDP